MAHPASALIALQPGSDRATERTAPEPARRGPPVLLGDCVTPLHGTTLLHALWQRWDGETEDDQR